jgi:hypothetical protein
MRFAISGWRNVPSMFDDLASNIREAVGPADGHYVTHEMVTVHWMRETTEKGDIIYRRMTDDEVEVLKSNDKEGNK